MTRFMGTSEVILDGKNRIVLPASFRKILPENFSRTFTLSEGLNKCISVYMKETWDLTLEGIDDLPESDPAAWEKKMIAYSATEVELDNGDRLLLPKSYLEHAGINKEIVVAGFGKYFQIWDKDTYFFNKKRSVENQVENELSLLNKYGDPRKMNSNGQ